jgi:hypothetical protein
MKVAVLTLTRDRLAYTKHCFQTLRENAGCDFDWYVLDQASEDGTEDWLLNQDDIESIVLHRNIGICPGLNLLLEEACNPSDYDVIVRFDNDCEVLQPYTLATVAGVAWEHSAILAPKVQGLKNPPAILAQYKLGEHLIDEVHHLGGIFMAIPAKLFTEYGYRYEERNAPWAGDEQICPWWHSHGGRVGYLHGFSVNHYLTTDGQAEDDTDYWDRKLSEMAA